MCSNGLPSHFYIKNSNQFLKSTFNCDLDHLKGEVKSIEVFSYSISNLSENEEDKILLSHFQYLFDQGRDVYQVLSFDQDNHILWRYEFVMDTARQKLLCQCYDKDNHLVELIENSLDTQKKIVQKSCYDTAGELLWEIKYHYDKYGDLLKIEPIPDLFFDCNIKSYYNENLDEIERIETSPSGSNNVKTYHYLYDEYKNWITQFERCEILNTITAIKKRIINYYD